LTILAALPHGALSADVCVIGTGPVGLAVALECDRLGLTVLALEAGNETVEEQQLEATPRADVVNPSHHAPLDVTMRQAFGGTSWAWSGACVPFDPVDFQLRPQVNGSGWPINHADVEPYYARATEILDCDPSLLPGDTDANAFTTATRFSRRRQLGLVHQEQISQSAKIMVCLNCPVTSLELSRAGDCIEAVTVATSNGPVQVKARHVVIAAGGLRSTQLLLATQRQWPHLFGGFDGPLGRYYMGHLTGWISAIRFTKKTEADKFQTKTVDGRPHVLQRLAIAEPVQLSESLLNTSFWPTNVAFFDPSHGSAVLSAAFLTLMLPAMGRKMMPPALRRASLGPMPRNTWGHCRNVIANPVKAASTVMTALWKKFVRREALGGFLTAAANGSFLLWYHAEHAPNPDSRVTLTEHVDNLGLPLMKVDLRYTAGDVEAVVKAHRVLDAELKARGLASLAFLVDEPNLPGRVLEQALDGYHQMGTTRMGTDPRTSVVDPECQVHSVRNLHVASSSVFPTSGQANPTLLATALAVRLANRIATRLNIERNARCCVVAACERNPHALFQPANSISLLRTT
jgi:choline dehydrogenase-like flavoprotein